MISVRLTIVQELFNYFVSIIETFDCRGRTTSKFIYPFMYNDMI